jgi:hypothetical protein
MYKEEFLMNAYKFETIVQNDGTIKIPQIKNLVNHKIEILIIDLSENKKKSFNTFEEFSQKWKGCIKGIHLDNYKEERIKNLEEKHT